MHHPTSHHKSVCPTILTSVNNPKYMELFKKPTTKEKFEPQIKILVSIFLSKIYYKYQGSKDHDQEHIHSEKCIKLLQQGCVRPTSKYTPNGGTNH
jgi:hypothetical protein